LEERIFLHPRFFRLFLEICFREEISDDLLEMLLAHLILCSLSVMHSARLRKVREKKRIQDGMGWQNGFLLVCISLLLLEIKGLDILCMCGFKCILLLESLLTYIGITRPS
jgi:hypothetical protein